MNSIHFSRKIAFFTFILILLAFSYFDVQVNANTSSSEPSFIVNQFNDHLTVKSPVYDNTSKLYMIIDAGILRNNSNPYVRISYVDAITNREVFFSNYVFHELIEYTQVNDSQTGPESNVIDKTLNIGSNNTLGTDLLSRGYLPLNTSVSTYQGQIVHDFVLTTLDKVFALQLHVPEGTIYPNDVQVAVPGAYLTVNVNNFPYTKSTSKLSMNVHITSSAFDTVDIIGSNKLYTYRGYNTSLNSTFYLQNAFFTGLESQYITPQIRDMSSYFNFIDPNRDNISLNAYIGQISTTANIPDTIPSLNSNEGGTGGILDFTINANAYNLQITGNQIALATFTIAGISGIIALVYYFMKKYLVYILGLVVAIAVTIYLPTRKVTAIQALHHEKRREIMDALYEAGGKGLLMKDLKDVTQLPQTTLLWHLDILQEFEFITRVKIHKQVIVISNDFLEEFDPRIKELELSFLSEQGEKFRDLISSKDINEPFTISEVVNKTQWHEKTAKRHIKRLIHLGIVIPLNNSNSFAIAPEFHPYFSQMP